MSGWSRFMKPHQADQQGFGSLFTIAVNYTKMSMMFPDMGLDYTDAVSSPFPKHHDGGTLHHVWISGCKYALTTIEGVGVEEQKRLLETTLRNLRERKSNTLIEG